ncbi:hypothetical protein LOTGIDRAFT_170072 [Lottia gigantea]|uniref:Uncharacterized protein n=1 Tax=Lottia gigantea TaxID=225164 RepID=V3ZNL1_LOTGI|nr:hypothetical protein LOTGIDRAFT_170072 [Lottia gigantea]ESO82441.1 hypothetical protein LOTGIDRAFT_170072 [Lottia gigantea]
MEDPSDEDTNYRPAVRKKLVVVGDGECGKTCLLHRYTHNQFLPEMYIPTVFDTCVHETTYNDKQVELVLHDTAGQEDFEVLRPLSYPDSDVILLCFSVDNADSLQNVAERWAPEIRHYCGNVPIILVGNKIDLRCDVTNGIFTNKLRYISYEEGNSIARRIGADVYCECSAKYNSSVTEIFEQALRLAMLNTRRKKR